MTDGGKQRSPRATAEELRELWESGVPLDSAWVKFAPFFDEFSLRALRTHPANDPELLHPDRRYQTIKEWLPTTWEGRQRKLEITTANERIRLLGDLYEGRLWAIGFPTLDGGFDEPVRVPRHCFLVDESGEERRYPQVHWTTGELAAGQQLYFDIRVVEAPFDTVDAVEDLTTSAARTETRAAAGGVGPVSDTEVRKRGGRPKTSGEIQKLAEVLLTTVREFARLPRSDQAEELRVRLLGDEEARHDESRPGYSTAHIQKQLGKVAQRLKLADETDETR